MKQLAGKLNMPHPPLRPTRMSLLVSLGCFLFFAFLLAVPNGYTPGAVILLLVAVWSCFDGSAYKASQSDKVLFAILAIVAITQLSMHVYHRNPLSYWELPSRYLLAILIFHMLLKHTPRLSWVISGVALGAIGGFGVAAYEVSQGALRAAGFTGGIQFGNLGLMLGIYCLLAAWGVYLYRRTLSVPVYLLVLCAALGLFASLWSGARGGWVALPWVILVFALCFPKGVARLKILGFSFVLLGVLAAGAWHIDAVQSRITEIRSELQAYEQGNADMSIGARLAIWQASFDIYAKHPVLGVSRAEYKQALADKVQNGELGEVPSKLANTHNMFLEVVLYTGLPGLLSLLVLLIYSAKVFWQRMASEDVAAKLAAAGGLMLVGNYFIFNQTQIMLGRNNTLLFFLISLGIFWAVSAKPYQAEAEVA